MPRPLIFLALLLLAQAGRADTPDPMHSAACRDALSRLQAEEGAGAASGAGRQARLEPVRRAAARACLGGDGEVPPPPRAAQAPVRVPAIVLPVPARHGAASPGAPPPAVQPPLRSITACDANGCWASDGTRLQRSPAGLLGPRGVCSVQGSVLNCP